MSKYSFLNRVEAVWNKLGGDEGVDRFLSGDLVVLENQFPFHLTGELAIEIPALARPTLKEVQTFQKGSSIRSIKYDTSPTSVVRLALATVLRSNEERVSEDEFERRITPKLDRSLGFQHAKWLVAHQTELPRFMDLLGKVRIYLPGIVVVDGVARYIPYLGKLGDHWAFFWGGVGNRHFDRKARTALSLAA